MGDRLNKSDWIRQGLRMLAVDGHGALKVGSLGMELGVSRGSFYWHFRDIGDFRSQLLQSWAEGTTDRVRQELEAGTNGSGRVKALIEWVLGSKLTLERAVRAWATADESVADTVASVDARRRAYVQELLLEAGVPDHLAPSRAAFLYMALLGRAFVMDSDQTVIATETAIDDLCDLLMGQRTRW